jgi:hypothetical protein
MDLRAENPTGTKSAEPAPELPLFKEDPCHVNAPGEEAVPGLAEDGLEVYPAVPSELAEMLPDNDNGYDVVATITMTGHIIMDLGPSPSPEVLDHARKCAAAMGGEFVIETDCLAPKARTAIAQRLAQLFLGTVGTVR